MDTHESCQVTAGESGAGEQCCSGVTKYVWSTSSRRIAYFATFHAVILFRVHAFRWWLRKRA